MKIKKFFKVSIVIVLLAFTISTFYFKSSTIMFSSNIEKSISNYWNNKVNIKEVKNFEAYGKKFKLVLSTPINNKKYKYVNCYEEKMNGLYYKNYQASEQGGSNALFNVSTVFVNDVKGSNKENYFTIVYGYNKDFQVVSYEIKVSGHEKGIISNVPSEEYFINAVNGKFLGIVKATDKNGTDKTDVFCD